MLAPKYVGKLDKVGVGVKNGVDVTDGVGVGVRFWQTNTKFKSTPKQSVLGVGVGVRNEGVGVKVNPTSQ